MTPFYLFKTHKINVTNLVQSMAMYNALEKGVLSPSNCFFSLHSSNFFINKLGSLTVACALGNDADSTFRHIEWNTNIQALNILDQGIKNAMDNNYIHIMGSHSNQQIQFLKKHFGDLVITVGVNYNSNTKDQLIYDVARFHVYLLQNNQINISTVDQELLATLSIDQLVKEYYNRFSNMSYIPESSFVECDYNIWVDDFADQEKMQQLMHDLDLPFTTQSTDIYKHWCQHQQFF